MPFNVGPMEMVISDTPGFEDHARGDVRERLPRPLAER
jgi:hypothetical protein